MTSALRKRSADADERFEIVHGQLLRHLPELVRELGGDVDHLLRSTGIDPAELNTADKTSNYRLSINLIELAAQELACRDLGMRLAVLQHRHGLVGPLGIVMRNSRTIGEGIDYVAEHCYAHSLATRIWRERLSSDRQTLVHYDVLLDRIPNKSQAMEHILLWGHLAVMEFTGGRARARRVHFRHQPVAPLELYRAYFGCDVLFGQNEDGLVFSAQDLACAISDPDEKAFQAATAFIARQFSRERPPLHALARGVITQLIWTGRCTNEQVASELRIHSRTLHRRLADEGTSFQKIKDEVRRDILIYCLGHTDLEFSRISEKLGFSEQSVMTRMCYQWLSASPTEIRARSAPRQLMHCSAS